MQEHCQGASPILLLGFLPKRSGTWPFILWRSTNTRSEAQPMRALFMLLLAINPMPSKDSVTEIALERTPCKGTCPVDRVILRSDGTASYTATHHVKLRGVYTGNVGQSEFEAIAKLVGDKGFFSLEGRYAAKVTCMPTVITTVKRGGDTKAVSNYGYAAPKELQDIEKRIIEMIGKVEWKPDLTASQPAERTDSR